MTTLLSLKTAIAIMCVLCASVLVAASLTVEFYKNPVTELSPLVGVVTTGGVGNLSVSTRFVGKGATLIVVGPASCSDQSGRYAEAFCTISDAPIGQYTVTVLPKGRDSIQAWVWVTGELVLQHP